MVIEICCNVTTSIYTIGLLTSRGRRNDNEIVHNVYWSTSNSGQEVILVNRFFAVSCETISCLKIMKNHLNKLFIFCSLTWAIIQQFSTRRKHYGEQIGENCSVFDTVRSLLLHVINHWPSRIPFGPINQRIFKVSFNWFDRCHW